MTDNRTPEWPAIGSWWRENDSRGPCAKQVIAHDKVHNRVQLSGSRKTWASLHRFNGRTGGYSKVPPSGAPFKFERNEP